MNITLIHALEVLVVLLVVGGLFQIRKLYIQSTIRNAALALSRRRALNHQLTSSSSYQSDIRENPAQKIFEDAIAGPSRENLPLPEVSFSEDFPVSQQTNDPEARRALKNNDLATHAQMLSKNDAALNSYIDDMFFESRYEFFEEPVSVKSKRSDLQNDNSDELLNLAAENSQFARVATMFNQGAKLAR